jgi:hypothetical protein
VIDVPPWPQRRVPRGSVLQQVQPIEVCAALIVVDRSMSQLWPTLPDRSCSPLPPTSLSFPVRPSWPTGSICVHIIAPWTVSLIGRTCLRLSCFTADITWARFWRLAFLCGTAYTNQFAIVRTWRLPQMNDQVYIMFRDLICPTQMFRLSN